MVTEMKQAEVFYFLWGYCKRGREREREKKRVSQRERESHDSETKGIRERQEQSD